MRQIDDRLADENHSSKFLVGCPCEHACIIQTEHAKMVQIILFRISSFVRLRSADVAECAQVILFILGLYALFTTRGSRFIAENPVGF